MAVGPAVKSPRPVLLAIALDREAAVGEIGEHAHRADAAAPFARHDHMAWSLPTGL